MRLAAQSAKHGNRWGTRAGLRRHRADPAPRVNNELDYARQWEAADELLARLRLRDAPLPGVVILDAQMEPRDGAGHRAHPQRPAAGPDPGADGDGLAAVLVQV